MTIDELIALAASLGTCIAAVLAYLSLRESSKQRKEAYRPQLAMKRQPIYGVGLEGLAVWTPQEVTGGVPMTEAFRYSARLFNIGLGPAKSISLRWNFDVKSMASEINRLASLNGSKRSVAERSKHAIEVQTVTGSRATFFLQADIAQTFDFALPYHSEDDGLDVTIPLSFQALVSMYFSEALGEFAKKEKQSDFAEFTKATLIIAYTDIGGQAYRQKFHAKVALHAFQYASDETGRKLYAELEFSSEAHQADAT